MEGWLLEARKGREGCEGVGGGLAVGGKEGEGSL